MRWSIALLGSIGGIILTILLQNNLTQALQGLTGWNADQPSGPSVLAAVLALGAVIGVATTALVNTSLARRTLLRFRLKTIKDVEAYFGHSVVGITPDYIDFTHHLGSGHDQSVMGEECHKLVIRLIKELKGKERRVLVTGSAPADGKSTLIGFVAEIISRLGGRVLIVDADLRSPSQHYLHRVDLQPGLSDFLAGGPLVVHNVSGASLITAGAQPPGVAEALHALDVDHLEAALGSKFDWILVDSPPVMGMADAVILSERVGTVLFAASLTKNPLGWIADAVNILQSSTTSKIMMVLSRIPIGQFSSTRDFWGYSYGYGYGVEGADDLIHVRTLASARPRTSADVRSSRIKMLLALLGLLFIILLIWKLLSSPTPEQIMKHEPFAGFVIEKSSVLTVLQVPQSASPDLRVRYASVAAAALAKAVNLQPASFPKAKTLRIRVQLDRWPDSKARYSKLGHPLYPYLTTIRFSIKDLRSADFENLSLKQILLLGVEGPEASSEALYERPALKRCKLLKPTLCI